MDKIVRFNILGRVTTSGHTGMFFLFGRYVIESSSLPFEHIVIYQPLLPVMNWDPLVIYNQDFGFFIRIRFSRYGRVRIRSEHQGLKFILNCLAVFIDQSDNTILKYQLYRLLCRKNKVKGIFFR